MLLINCKVGEGFAMFDWSFRIDRIIDGTSVLISMHPITEPERLFLVCFYVRGWVQHPSMNIFIELYHVSTNRAKFRIDAPREYEVHRIKRPQEQLTTNEVEQ